MLPKTEVQRVGLQYVSVLCGCEVRCEDTRCGHCNATTCGSERKVVGMILWQDSTNLEIYL